MSFSSSSMAMKKFSASMTSPMMAWMVWYSSRRSRVVLTAAEMAYRAWVVRSLSLRWVMSVCDPEIL